MQRLILLVLILGGALAQAPALKVEKAWVRLVPGKVTAAYMTLLNPGPKAVKILGASSPVAATAEIHETLTMEHGQATAHGGPGMGDVKGMKPMGVVTIAAGGKLEMKPGGTHLMFTGLNQMLREGQKVKIVFKLEGGQNLSFEAPVVRQ